MTKQKRSGSTKTTQRTNRRPQPRGQKGPAAGSARGRSQAKAQKRGGGTDTLTQRTRSRTASPVSNEPRSKRMRLGGTDAPRTRPISKSKTQGQAKTKSRK